MWIAGTLPWEIKSHLQSISFSSKNTFKRQPVLFNTYLDEALSALTISYVKNPLSWWERNSTKRWKNTAVYTFEYQARHFEWKTTIYCCGVWECNQWSQKKSSPLRLTFSRVAWARGKPSFSHPLCGPMKSLNSTWVFPEATFWVLHNDGNCGQGEKKMCHPCSPFYTMQRVPEND